MELPIFQVDAFAERVFTGNPAAVMPLERWLDDVTLQALALENNLSETAFLVARADGAYDLRWFTPLAEVELCGHATLASAHVVLTALDPRAGQPARQVRFHSRSGPLDVRTRGELYELDFPTDVPRPVAVPAGLAAAVGAAPGETRIGALGYLLATFDDEAAVRALEPDAQRLKALDVLAVLATAPGDEVDFVSRFFAPRVGVLEDPVTGSAHCVATPYWVERLGRNPLVARQVSARGGEVHCELRGERVRLSGRAVTYLEGRVRL